MNQSTSLYKRFVGIFLIAFAIPAFFIAVFNFFVDPFSIYHSLLLPKFNQVKVNIDRQQRLYKAFDIAKQKPMGILFGSSRTAAGIDPCDLEAILNVPVYNAGFDGASFEEIYHYFEHALYHQPHLKTVVIGIDLFAFHAKKKPQKDFSLSRLQAATWSWNNFISILFNKASLASSLKTIKENFFSFPLPIFLPNGQRNPKWMESDNNEYLVKGDWEYLNMIFQCQEFYLNFQLDPKKIDLFKCLVERCKENHIDLKVFICPSKAIYWDALYRKELWKDLEALKLQLSQFHPIWDFSGFNEMTTQQLELQGQPLYFECSHFRPYLGRLILNTMFKELSPVPFGYLLTPETVHEALSNIRKQHAIWLEQYPDLASKVEKALNKIP